ncbi:MAG TPA: hypothetical protein VGR20_00040, partial [Acidimicrobiia bacterium]|nr:hypothetical protein [Acidimicrobiia bacterium]
MSKKNAGYAAVALHRVPTERLRRFVTSGVVALEGDHPARPGEIQVVDVPVHDDPMFEHRLRQTGPGQHPLHPQGEFAPWRGVAVAL